MNYHIATIIKETEFKSGTLQNVELDTGILARKGQLQKSGHTVAQSYLFDSSVFTSDQAKKWLKKTDRTFSLFMENNEEVKAESLSDKLNSVYQAFSDTYNRPQESSYGYVLEVFDDYVICQVGEELYKVTYSTSGEDVTFQDRADWTVVEKEYVPVKSNFLVMNGTEVKALGDGKVGGYLVRFSDETKPDLVGDFFTSETDFGYHKSTPIFYHHGLDKTLGMKSIGVGTLKMDDIGVWVEAQLELADAYAKAIYGMAEKGKLGWSSGTAPHLVRRKKKGSSQKVLSWLLGLDASLTPTPCEPMNTATVLKSIDVSKLSQIEPETTNETAQNNSDEGNKRMDNKEVKTVPSQEVLDGVLETVQQEIKAKNERKAAETKQRDEFQSRVLELVDEAMKSADPNNKGGKNGGGSANLNLKTKLGDNENDAFWYYLRTGDQAAYKATVILNEGDDEQGGAVVPKDFSARIREKRDESSIIRVGGADIIQTSLKTVDVPIEGTAEAAPVATNESAGATPVSYDQNQVEPLDTATITLTKYTRLHRVSEELLNDQKANLESFLAARVGRAFAKLENTLFFTAATSGSIVNVSGAGKTAAAAATLAVGDVTGLYYSLPDFYRQGAIWVSTVATEGLIRTITGNPFYFAPTPQGEVGDAASNPLMGHRLFNTSAMSAVAASAKSLFFGNLEFYTIAENGGFSVKRLNERFADTGEVGFIFSIRIGGVANQTEALKHLVHPSA